MEFVTNGTCAKKFWAQVKVFKNYRKNNFSVKFAKLRRNFAQNDWSDIVFEWEFVKRLTIFPKHPKHPTFSIFAKHVAIYAFFG